ncbi:uncharacterized protein LOC117320019 [Pecten maximus]|uniref:uncharacterized protein LOC117320019 n=1 Tax=Pecten maximus TaxID=6579 RepID=UPI0014582C98|nr:uncharacterized protein LOC117320019 [Pecten maximus]
MVKRCCWGTCNTDSRFPDRLEGGVTFIPFPKPGRSLEKCKEWIRLCGRPQSQLNEEILRERSKAKHLFVCSKHFVDGKPSDLYPNPRSALPYDRITPSRKRPMPRPDLTKSTKRKILDIVDENDNIEMESIVVPSEVQLDMQKDDNLLMKETQPLDLLALAAENRRLDQEHAKLISNNARLSEGYSKMILQYEQLCRKTTSHEVQGDSKAMFNCNNLKPSDYQYYTGFSSDRFHNLVKFFIPSEEEPFTFTKTVSGTKNVSLEDQLLLVLMKLRQNFDFVHLSNLFMFSSQACSTIFSNWINYMFFKLGSLVIWPKREEIVRNMPSKYKEDFPDTIVIIDGTELKIQKPSALNRQSQCYSDYKSCTTLKALVGVDPRGSVIFASMLFSGSISDKVLTKESGFLNLLTDLIEQQK